MALIHVEFLLEVYDDELDFPIKKYLVSKLFDWYDQPYLEKCEVKIDGSLV